MGKNQKEEPPDDLPIEQELRPTSALVQDSVEASGLVDGRTSVPVKLHTLVVRRPGRVQAAMEFARLCLGVRSFGAAGEGEFERDSEGELLGTPKPIKELAGARAAAFRTLENYFAGTINDELVVHAEFRIQGRDYQARFIGEFDGATGVLKDPRYTPKIVPDPKASAEPVRDVNRRETLLVEREVGPYKGLSAQLTLPPGLLPQDVETVEDSLKDPNAFRLTLVNGNKLVIDGRTGDITG